MDTTDILERVAAQRSADLSLFGGSEGLRILERLSWHRVRIGELCSRHERGICGVGAVSGRPGRGRVIMRPMRLPRANVDLG